MKTLYNVHISKFTTITELPNAWTDKNYTTLLEEMDYGDTSTIDPSELKEMCMMAITDNEPNEAAKILLDYIFKDELNDGQKENLSHEMIDEKMWEQLVSLFYQISLKKVMILLSSQKPLPFSKFEL